MISGINVLLACRISTLKKPIANWHGSNAAKRAHSPNHALNGQHAPLTDSDQSGRSMPETNVKNPIPPIVAVLFFCQHSAC